jgi:hypothetical protein
MDTESNAPIIDFATFVRGSIEYKKYKKADYLELQDCVIAPTRFYYQEVGDIFDRAKWTYGLSIGVAIKPQIRISLTAPER